MKLPPERAGSPTTKAVLQCRETPRVVFGGEFPGIPLSLVAAAPAGPAREEFDHLVDFSAVSPASQSLSKPSAASASVPAFDIALQGGYLGSHSDENQDAFDGHFEVEFDHGVRKLRIRTTPRSEDEVAAVIMVRYGSEEPFPVTLTRPDETTKHLEGQAPPPTRMRDEQALVQVRDAEPKDLPLLDPVETAVWLAHRPAIAVKLTYGSEGYAANFDDGDFRFLSEHPAAFVALRAVVDRPEVRDE
ncbi:MAG: hypothetical protein QM775_24420 [Pirellulales bacterium]